MGKWALMSKGFAGQTTDAMTEVKSQWNALSEKKVRDKLTGRSDVFDIPCQLFLRRSP